MHTLFSLLPEPQWLWLGFVVLLPILLAVDVARPPPTPRGARYKTLFLAGLAVCFAGLLLRFGGPLGRADATAFFTAWLVELALSVDNLFVFLLLFAGFSVHGAARARVLSYGIFGALILRGLCIASGVALVTRFAWLFYIFGAVLVFSGAKLLWPAGEGHTQAEPAIAKFARKWLPMASPKAQQAQPQAFVVREHSRLKATNLGVLLVAIEASDLVFALDSVPAGFAITSSGWLLFASNALAILGLRALFVALDQALGALRFLPIGLAGILLFIGSKMLLHDVWEVSMGTSLAVIAIVLLLAVTASVVLPAKTTPHARS